MFSKFTYIYSRMVHVISFRTNQFLAIYDGIHHTHLSGRERFFFPISLYYQVTQEPINVFVLFFSGNCYIFLVLILILPSVKYPSFPILDVFELLLEKKMEEG